MKYKLRNLKSPDPTFPNYLIKKIFLKYFVFDFILSLVLMCNFFWIIVLK